MAHNSLWALPAQPLPDSNLLGAIFVTVWFVLSLACAGAIYKMARRTNLSKNEARNFLAGTTVLAV